VRTERTEAGSSEAMLQEERISCSNRNGRGLQRKDSIEGAIQGSRAENRTDLPRRDQVNCRN
jgi:hypothetical protein